jgi:phage-related protein
VHSSKPIEFVGDSLDALRRFPEVARRRAGYQLDRLQQGLEPNDWKPMSSIGAGVREIRIREERGAFRVVYVTKFGETAVYVLHCFQKKTQKTSSTDIEIATRRYREVQKEHGS